MLASRFQEPERASVVLPTVTCSSCSAPIALSSLGNHVCQPAPPMPRAQPSRPAQIAIPQSRQGVPGWNPSRQDPYSARPAFAGPSSAHPSPTEFAIPRRPSANTLTPHSPNFPQAYSPQIKIPSPSSPFFPNSAGGYSSHASPEHMQMHMVDTTTGGESGMAGVGRRAFAAAAWSVRAGVSLAANAKQRSADNAHVQEPPQVRAPPQTTAWPQARPEIHRSHTAAIPQQREAAPLRVQSPASPPQRSYSAMDQRTSPLRGNAGRGVSISSSASSQSGLADLLSGKAQRLSSNKRDFFEKVKELNRSGSVLSRSNTMTTGKSNDRMVSSPVDTSFDLDDDYENQPSALPWASPDLDETPRLHIDTHSASPERVHRRQATDSSDTSSESSKSGRWGATSGPESEEVVTPSQSFDGLADRARGEIRLGQIGEEEEDVLGLMSKVSMSDQDGGRIPPSGSVSTIASSPRYPTTTVPNTTPNYKHSPKYSHQRMPSVKSPSASKLAPPSPSGSIARKQKSCQKCGEIVGGSKRFVKRDGIVLCEKDWKKLYLPSCRRCTLPIEKSAVSSSDGQLKGKWHRACFTCSDCDKPFADDDFYVLRGKPWCQFHYHEQNGTLCCSSSCRQPIEGACIVLPGPDPQRYHAGHFRCDHRGSSSSSHPCKESMDEYYDVDGKRYCERHAGEMMRAVRRGGGRELKAEKRRTRLIDLSAM
ncbi:hypothetical protein L198_03725 [Cryptococcus wingfieldii CBS 7118]|uniref:LIM zinc-binding domain-containing protein n=1 Tax=Cryptococcus wingfieldii CBS 7118 TaxID=1295528 RepID=A0A1E3JC71_9TREE|nr:hypothetical protein L198_03725 [Cryptococcus wingfieldii CBS 7118]ODN98480.1 hypothetical protein L198_03725 [Cryptococcus wingfieldii CBS 7118]